MEPQILDHQSFAVVGLPLKVGRTTTHEISTLWDRLIARVGEIAGRIDGSAYGLLHNFDKHEGAFDYLAGVAVEGKAEVPEGMERIEVAAQTFAVFTHRIENPVLSQDLPRAFNYIYGTWLPDSGYLAAEGPELEYYDSRFDPSTNSGEIDLYIPVLQEAQERRPGGINSRAGDGPFHCESKRLKQAASGPEKCRGAGNSLRLGGAG